MLRWHVEFSENFRKKFNLSTYSMYWICWLEGLILGLIISYFIF